MFIATTPIGPVMGLASGRSPFRLLDARNRRPDSRKVGEYERSGALPGLIETTCLSL
jgi:hypothetical protein